jgi:hypothetical protein
MRHTIVSYTVKPGRERENAALVRAVFEELAETLPPGMRYAAFQAADSGEFIHVYTDEGATSAALQELPAFKAFVDGAADRHEQAATFKQFDTIGSYRTFEDPDRPMSPGVPAAAGSADPRTDAGVVDAI